MSRTTPSTITLVIENLGTVRSTKPCSKYHWNFSLKTFFLASISASREGGGGRWMVVWKSLRSWAQVPKLGPVPHVFKELTKFPKENPAPPCPAPISACLHASDAICDRCLIVGVFSASRGREPFPCFTFLIACPPLGNESTQHFPCFCLLRRLIRHCPGRQIYLPVVTWQLVTEPRPFSPSVRISLHW